VEALYKYKGIRACIYSHESKEQKFGEQHNCSCNNECSVTEARDELFCI